MNIETALKALPPLSAPETLRRRILSALDESAARPAPFRFRFSTRVFAPACAAAAVLLTGAGLYWKSLKQAPGPVEAPVSSEAPLPESPAPEPMMAAETPEPAQPPAARPAVKPKALSLQDSVASRFSPDQAARMMALLEKIEAKGRSRAVLEMDIREGLSANRSFDMIMSALAGHGDIYLEKREKVLDRIEKIETSRERKLERRSEKSRKGM